MRTFFIFATATLASADKIVKTSGNTPAASAPTGWAASYPEQPHLTTPVGHVSGSVKKASPTESYGSTNCPIKCISTQAQGASSHASKSDKGWIIQVFHTTSHATGAHGPANQNASCQDNLGGCTSSTVVPHMCKHDAATDKVRICFVADCSVVVAAAAAAAASCLLAVE